MEAFIGLTLLVLLLAAGVPIAFSILASALVGIYLVVGDIGTTMSFLAQIPFQLVNTYTLTAIPMFVLLAFIIGESEVADDVFRGLAVWFGRLKIGVPAAAIMSSVVLGAMSGSSSAAAAALSRVCLPSFRREGFSDSLAGGTIALGSTLSIIVPPSMMLILYGIMTGTPIGPLFMAGVGPGLLLGILLLVTLQCWLLVRPGEGRGTRARFSIRQKLAATRRTIPALVLIAGILGSLYGGFATPTEVASLGSLFAVGLGVTMRRLSLSRLRSAAESTLLVCGMIIIVFVAATVFSRFMSLTRVPHTVISAVAEAELSPAAIIALIVIGYFVLSMVMDEGPLLLITLPITFPVVTSLGYDPVWFGAMSAMMVVMGLIFPPVGMVAFIVAQTSGIPVGRVYRGCMVLLVPVIVTTLVLMFVPDLALWLPNSMAR